MFSILVRKFVQANRREEFIDNWFLSLFLIIIKIAENQGVVTNGNNIFIALFHVNLGTLFSIHTKFD